MQRVVLTGGLGFIGSHLVDKLLEGDYDVSIVDDFSTGQLQNISTHTDDPRLHVIEGNILDRTKVARVVSNADAVVHLAAITSVIRSSKEPLLVHDVNVTGTLNVLESCVENAVERFVFISSAAVYGSRVVPPFPEDLPSYTLSLYASSKVAGEAYCQAYRETHDLETVVIRLMNIYGPRRSAGPYAGVMMKFAESVTKGKPITIFGDGKQTRDFTHATDAAQGIALALEKKSAEGETFNIGTGIPCEINHLAELFLRTSNSQLPILHAPSRPGEIRESYADVSKAKELLGYEPKVTLEEGLKGFLNWYREYCFNKVTGTL